MSPEISFQDFLKVDIRVGTILSVEAFPEARNPAYIITVDLGKEIGIKKSSAQITGLYEKEHLIGKQILAVVNFPKKQIGPLQSEVLVLGLSNEEQHVVLIEPQQLVENGKRLH